MEGAVDKFLEAFEGDLGKEIFRNHQKFGKDYASRNPPWGCRGLFWVLRHKVKVIDLAHICKGKVGVFRKTSSLEPTSDLPTPQGFQDYSFRVVDPSEVSSLKIKKVFYIGESPKYYIFSGSVGYHNEKLKKYLLSRQIYPYPDSDRIVNGELIYTYPKEGNVPIPFGVDYVYYLNMDVVSAHVTYDRSTFLLTCHVQNVCEARSIQNLTLKDVLHRLLNGNKYIAKTWELQDFTYRSGAYILRASHVFACGGVDVFFINSKESFDSAVKYYSTRISDVKGVKDENVSRYKVIVSEYISDPMLFEGKKFHVRLYGLVTSEDSFFKISRFGEILTSKKPFKLEDFHDEDIHDTHFAKTSRDIYFPTDFRIYYSQDMLDHINEQLDELEVILSKLSKPRAYYAADKAYMFFGIDIMIRTNGNIVLLEVNNKPGMDRKTPDSKEAIAHGRRIDKWKWRYTKHLFD